MNHLRVIFFMPLLMLFRFFSKKNHIVIYSPFDHPNATILNEYLKLELNGYNVVYFNVNKQESFFYLFNALVHTKLIFLTHGFGRLSFFGFCIKTVQLWHGYPIKKILLDNKKEYNPFDSKLVNVFLRCMYKLRLSFSYNYLVVSNDIPGCILSDSFQLNESKILKLGDVSRNYKSKNKDKSTRLNSINYFLYAPTWRDFREYNVHQVNDIISALDKVGFFSFNHLYVKPHPFEFDVFKQYMISHDRVILAHNYDINDLIVYSNGVITDYSSLIIEVIKLGKPLFLFTPDVESYSKSRDFYDYYLEIFKESYMTVEELLVSMLSVHNKTFSSRRFSLDLDDSDALKKIVNFIHDN